MLKATPKFALHVAAGLEEYRLSVALANGKFYEAIPLMREIGLAAALNEIAVAAKHVTQKELQRRAAEELLRWYKQLPAASRLHVGQLEIPERLRRREKCSRPANSGEMAETRSDEAAKKILATSAAQRRSRRVPVSDAVLQLEDLFHDRSRKKPKR